MLAASSSPWSLREWQTGDGLPDNNVTGVAQTSDGYIWVATHAGVARFDGVRFQPWPLPGTSGRSNLLVRTLLAGRDARVWVALEAESGLVAGFSAGATNIYRTADGLSGFRPLVMVQTPDAATWVGYVDGSACRLQHGRVTRFAGTDAGLPGIGGCWLTTDIAGKLWFAKAGRIGVFQGNRFESRFTVPERTMRLAPARDGGIWILAGRRLLKSEADQEPVLLGEIVADRPGVEASVVYEDRSGGLWLGTEAGGLFHWDGKGMVPAETSHSDIESITEDREGNIWVGTGGGGLDRLRQRVLALHGSASGLPFDTARSVCEDAAGGLWATGANGALVRFQEESWQPVAVGAGWIGDRATCVASDRQGGVWIGTYHGGLFHWQDGAFSVVRRKDGLGGENVRALLVDRGTNLWIGLESPNCLQRFHDGEFLTLSQPAGSRTIRTIVEDARGEIWLGTFDGSLLRVAGEILVNETVRALQPTRPIRTMHATTDGALWIGYAGVGVGRLLGGQFTHFGSEQGLPDNNISGIESDEQGAMWFASARGIFQVRRRELDSLLANQTKRVVALDFGRNEGLPNLQGSYGYWPTTARTRDGRIWFATHSGLVAANANHIQPNRIPPVVIIERLLTDGRAREIKAPEGMTRVPPGIRRLDIEFTALSFAAPESILFQSKLEGWDAEWSAADSQRSVSYSRLAPGKYEFHVRARNNAGIWNLQGPTLRFLVEPFIWETWWFRTLAGTLAGVLLVWGVRTYERRKVRHKLAALEREHAIERERTRIARDIHDELGTGLTQIGLLADMGAMKPVAAAAEANFGKIGERARAAVRSLDEIVWAANPRNDFLPRLADYLWHLADDCFEAEGSARCRQEVPTGLPAIPVGAELRHNLVLAVKEALTNSLKHGRAETVWLRLQWHDPELIITVEDNGVGFDPANSTARGNGLTNQMARMREIGGAVEVYSTPGAGTRSVFRVRLTAAG